MAQLQQTTLDAFRALPEEEQRVALGRMSTEVKQALLGQIKGQSVEPQRGMAIDAKPTMGAKALKWVMGTAAKEGPAMIGGAIGGAAGIPFGPPGIATLAALGGAGGEAIRQLINRATGQPAPQTSQEAAQGVTGGAVTGFGQEAGAIGARMGTQALSNVMRRGSERLTERILAPTKEGAKFLTQKTKGQLAKERIIALTRPGYAAQIEKGMTAANQKLDEAWALLPEDAKLNSQPILNALRTAKKEFVVEGEIVEPAAVEHIDKIMGVIRNFGDDISPHSLRKVRQIWDRTVARAGGFKGKELNEASALYARKEGANAIRAELAKQFPDIKKINAEFNFWSNADEVIQETLKRTSGQFGRTFETLSAIGGATGAISRGGGLNEAALWAGTLGLLSAAIRSPGAKSMTSATASKLADLIMEKNFIAAAALLGRTTGMLTSRELLRSTQENR